MEEIEKNLKENEKILWKSSLINKDFIEDLKAFNLLIFIGIFLFIFIFICSIIWAVPLFLALYIVTTFPNLVTFILIKTYFYFKTRYMKKLNLKFKEFKNYENIYILTNRRWIQKSIYVLDMAESSLPSNILEIKGDLAITNIENIKIFSVGKYVPKLSLSKTLMKIQFNLNEEKNDWKPLGLGPLIPYPVLPEFMKILKDLIPIKKEEQEYTTTAYYFR